MTVGVWIRLANCWRSLIFSFIGTCVGGRMKLGCKGICVGYGTCGELIFGLLLKLCNLSLCISMRNGCIYI